MLAARKKQLKKSIAIGIALAVALLIANGFLALKVKVKVDERIIYHAIAKEYPNLTYDKELAKIAEDCARQCLAENINGNDVKILENEDFVSRYSVNVSPVKYTNQTQSNDEFVDDFLSVMEKEANAETKALLEQCQYIGVGKCEKQVFILAFYKE